MSVLDVALPHEEPWRVLKYRATTAPRCHLVPQGTAVSLCGLGGSRGWKKGDWSEPKCARCERIYYSHVQAAIMDDGDETP